MTTPLCARIFPSSVAMPVTRSLSTKKAPHLLVQQQRDPARQQGLDEVSDEADALAAHVPGAPVGHELLVPFGEIVDPAPRGLLLGGDEERRVLRNAHLVAPFAEIEAGDQLGLDRAPGRAGAVRHAEVVVDQPAHEAERNPARLEELQHLGRMVDQGRHPVLVELAAAEEAHIGEDVVARIGSRLPRASGDCRRSRSGRRIRWWCRRASRPFPGARGAGPLRAPPTRRPGRRCRSRARRRRRIRWMASRWDSRRGTAHLPVGCVAHLQAVDGGFSPAARPRPEEARSAVSKDGHRRARGPSFRDARLRPSGYGAAPQDEVCGFCGFDPLCF